MNDKLFKVIISGTTLNRIQPRQPMDPVRKFFKKQKTSQHFKSAGQGQRLGSSSDKQPPPQSRPGNDNRVADVPNTVSRDQQASERADMAANAALKRLEEKNRPPQYAFNKRLDASQIEHQRKLDQEALELADRLASKEVFEEKPRALERVCFRCPALIESACDSSSSYGWADINRQINEVLYLQLTSTTPDLAATRLLLRGIELTPTASQPADFKSSDGDWPTVSQQIEKRLANFTRILTNLIDHPDKPVYRKLRLGNQLIKDLCSVESAELFLQTIGFVPQELPSQANNDASTNSVPNDDGEVRTDSYLVLPEPNAEQLERLRSILQTLTSEKPLLPELCRDTRVYKTTSHLSASLALDRLPDEFFTISKQELRHMLKTQRQNIEDSRLLLTKAQRERLRTQVVRKYRYALIRVRLPDGNYVIQGTFHATDQFTLVRQWVSDCLADPALTFTLWTYPSSSSGTSRLAPSSHVEITNDSASLNELELSPCGLIYASLVSDGQTVSSQSPSFDLLKPDLAQKVTDL